MPQRISKWICVFCGTEFTTELGAQQCETNDQTKMATLARTVNRHIRCANPQCSRHIRPYLRSDWVPKNLSDRPWHSYDGCPECGSPFEEYVARSSEVDTPELDKAVDILREGEKLTPKLEQSVFPFYDVDEDTGVIEITEDMLKHE